MGHNAEEEEEEEVEEWNRPTGGTESQGRKVAGSQGRRVGWNR